MYTSPVLHTPEGTPTVGGIVEDTLHKVESYAGLNTYYGGQPPYEPGPSSDNTHTHTRKEAYTGRYLIQEGIGLDRMPGVWDIGAGVPYIPFVWYSTIKGAEGYCVGAKADSTRMLPEYWARSALSKYSKVIAELDSTIRAIQEEIAYLQEEPSEDSAQQLASLQDTAGMMTSIRTSFITQSTKEAKQGKEDADRELLYTLFIACMEGRVRLLRNDFASDELLFAVDAGALGCGFMQQVPAKREAKTLTTLWR